MSEPVAHIELINDLTTLVGSSYILTNETKMEPYSKGFRFG